MKKTKVKKYFTGGEMAGAMGGDPYSLIAQQVTDFANNLDTQQLANIGMNSNPYSKTQLKTSQDMRDSANQQGIGAFKAGLSGKPGEAFSNLFNMGISALENFQNRQKSGFSSGEDQQFVQNNQADIMQRNKMFNLANGGTLPVNEFQQYRDPYRNLQPLQNTIPTAANSFDLEAIPPQRYNPFVPMESIKQPINNAPIDIENQWAKLPGNSLDPTNKIYDLFSTNKYKNVPTSINNNIGRQYSLSDIAGSRNEQKRNQDILNYLTHSKQTAQEILKHKQKHPEYFMNPGTYEGTLQTYLTSPEGQNKLSEALGEYDDINLGQRTTNPTYHANGGMLNYFDGGFKHDDNNPDNVFEGIPQGMAPDNSMNVVEKGETKLGDYVFSDNLKVDKNLSKQFDIPKGKTFAAVSKKINKELLDRPNDTYTKATVEHNLQNLMRANDIARDMKEVSSFKNGGRMNKYQGGGFTNSPEMEALIEKANNNPQSLTADERNIIQRLGDRVYQNYQENRPALFQDFPIFDPINPMLEYVTGNTPNMVDGEGNPIQGGGAPMVGFRAGNMGTRTLRGAKGSIQRNIPRQTFTPSGKPAFTKGRSKATHTRKPVGDFDFNYDPLAGGRKASPDVIAKRQAAKRAKNLEKARAAKKEKAYQKLLDESSTVKSGINIPKELEGTVRFGNNNLSNFGKGLGYAGLFGSGIYGATHLFNNSAVENTSTQNNVASGNGSNFDVNSFFSNYQNNIADGPAQGIPFRYNTEIPTQQPVADSTPQSTPINYLNIQQIMQNMSPEERRSFIQKLAETKNPFGELTKMGYTPGGKGVSWQQSGAEHPFYGGVNAEILNQVSNPNLMNQVFGGTKDSYTKEDLQRLQREIMNDPNASQYVVNPEQPDFGVDWLVGSSMGPDFTAQPMTRKEITLTNPNIDLELSTSTSKKPPTDKDKEDDDLNINLPNLWPEAGMAAAMIPLPKAPKVAPTTISAGLLNPQLVDEQTMRANIDASNRASTGALANVTGGSGAAQRAGLLGAGKNYMDATGGAFLQSNAMNNQARMMADQFNIQNQTGIAGTNQQALNQAEMFNKQAQYKRDLEQYDTRLGAFQDYTGTKYDHRKYRDANKIFTDFYGYNEEGLRTPMKSGGKLCVRKSLR